MNVPSEWARESESNSGVYIPFFCDEWIYYSENNIYWLKFQHKKSHFFHPQYEKYVIF